jgi:ubiquinone/menaquinone biosynthesis C-methylase UbiE
VPELESDEAWDPVEYKEFTRSTWDYAAPAYIPFARRYLEPYGQALLKMLKVPKNARVLDIASGAGEPAITLAKRMGASVTVIGVDLAPKMVELANLEAKRRRAFNVRFQEEDAEHLSFKNNSFDVVTCRFGLQIFTDPEKALYEMRRVLKPAGQVGVAVWGLSWRADFIDIFIGAIVRNTAQPEYIPTPYEFGNIKELAHALEKAGFRDVRNNRVTLNLTTDSPLQYWDAFRRATPLGPVLTYHPKAHVRKVKADVFRRLRSYPRRRGKIIVPCEAVLAVGRK